MQHTFKKKYGQNFLKNQAIVDKIVRSATIMDNSTIIEVGPGAGILTKALASVSPKNRVIAYEIDNSLKDHLDLLKINFSNLEVYFGDFLQVDLEKDLSKYSLEHLYFVSNVPYYITSPILFKLIDSRLYFNKIVMMVQKEVGNRFCAAPCSRQYSALTVLLRYYFVVKREFLVDRNQFIPRPNVDSVVVSFTSRCEKEKLIDESFFKKIVHDSFQYKRKTIRNNLKNYDLKVIEDVLNNYHYDLNVRAEQLDYFIFVEIANALKA